MSIAISLLGIVLSLTLLITLAYRGHSVIFAAPIAALVAVLFSGAPVLATYTQVFMPALGGFIVNFFPLFLLGAIFGALMNVTGLASDFAQWISKLFGPKRSLLVTVLATAMLTYGGVSSWVIAFTIYPIAVALFREANIPKRLMPAAIALGIFTFATAALPGSPQIHNAIPTRFFGTTIFAAPILGLVGATVTFILGMMWLQYRAKKMHLTHEGYDSHLAGLGTSGSSTGAREPSHYGDSGAVLVKEAISTRADWVWQRGLIGLVPLLVVVVTNVIFTYVVPAIFDFSYLSEEKYGAIDLSKVLGTWSVLVGLVAAIIAILIIKPRSLRDCVVAFSEGAKRAVVPALTTASEVGYGAVIASLAIFAVVAEGLFGLSDNPLILGALTTAVISGITGSSSGGLSITLATFSDQLTALADQAHIPLDVLHRVMAMASVSFDSLPHNGAIVTLLIVTGMTHRQSYKDIGVVTVIVPAIGVLVVLALSMVIQG